MISAEERLAAIAGFMAAFPDLRTTMREIVEEERGRYSRSAPDHSLTRREVELLIKHQGVAPTLDPTAFVAHNTVVCGDVTVGPGCRIMHGAQVIAEGGTISIGRDCIIMENAVLRASARHPLRIGDHCLVGPNAHVVGCTVEDEIFIATGAAVFHGARLGRGSEVRINGVVHVNSRLGAGKTVPIGWVAVGDPAQVLPPDQHERIWAIQEPLDFPLTVYGFQRGEASMEKITRRLSQALASHASDEPLA